jgi:hypothetical protein
MNKKDLEERNNYFNDLTENEKVIYTAKILKSIKIEDLINYRNNLNEVIKTEEIKYFNGRLNNEYRKPATINESICLYLELNYLENIIYFYNTCKNQLIAEYFNN